MGPIKVDKRSRLILKFDKVCIYFSIFLRKSHVGFIFIAFKAMNEFAIEIKVHHARVLWGGPEVDN